MWGGDDRFDRLGRERTDERGRDLEGEEAQGPAPASAGELGGAAGHQRSAAWQGPSERPQGAQLTGGNSGCFCTDIGTLRERKAWWGFTSERKTVTNKKGKYIAAQNVKEHALGFSVRLKISDHNNQRMYLRIHEKNELVRELASVMKRSLHYNLWEKNICPDKAFRVRRIINSKYDIFSGDGAQLLPEHNSDEI